MDDLQDAWAITCDPAQLVEMGKSMSDLWTTGFFSDIQGMGRGSFKFKAEQEYMEERKIKYEVEDRNTSLLGCIAKQCSRSKSDQVRTINNRGKKIHGNIITRMSRRGAKTLMDNHKDKITIIRASVKKVTGNEVKGVEVKVSQTRKTLRLLHAERVGGLKKGRMGNIARIQAQQQSQTMTLPTSTTTTSTTTTSIPTTTSTTSTTTLSTQTSI